jgi:hypothetical protein
MRIAIVFPRRLLLPRIVAPCCAAAYATHSAIEDSKMTDATGNDRIRMTVAEARALGEAAMRGVGYDNDDARILTDHVLDAALCGYEYSGLPKLLKVVDYPDFRQPRRPVTVVRQTAATAMLEWWQHHGDGRGLSRRRGDNRARRSERPRHRLPRQQLDDRTQRLLLRNDRAPVWSSSTRWQRHRPWLRSAARGQRWAPIR